MSKIAMPLILIVMMVIKWVEAKNTTWHDVFRLIYAQYLEFKLENSLSTDLKESGNK